MLVESQCDLDFEVRERGQVRNADENNLGRLNVLLQVSSRAVAQA